MPKPKIKKESSLAEFVKRPMPTDDEVKDFEEFISSSAVDEEEAKKEEKKDEEIEESLSEIYNDKNGEITDVKKLEIKKKRGFFFWFFTLVFIGALFAGVAYGAYYLYTQSGADSKLVEFSIDGKEKIIAGEEFFYDVNIKNLDRVDINNIEVRLTYPENFIFLDSEPQADLRNDTWKIDLLGVHRSKKIKIKGKIIDQKEEKSIILADISYVPANFSSEFKKSASFETVVDKIGVDFLFDYASSAMVGEDNEIIIKYKEEKENYLNNFRVRVESFIQDEKGQAENLEVNKEFKVEEIIDEEKEIAINFKIKEKQSKNQDIILKFEHLYRNEENGEIIEEYYLFKEEIINLEVIKSDLNLNLIINASQADQGIDFGQTLNYSLTYDNKGETEMSDVVIMAVLESEFLNWKTLEDENDGKISGNTISWSKEEIPELELLEKNNDGSIDFSIKVLDKEDVVSGKDYQIKSYVQYSIGDSEDAHSSEDMKSNTIINKINSDLELEEQVRYFNDDNIAVGNGPIPPKVGETTSFKIYWTITNNLHELNNLQVLAELPSYVSWNEKNQASTGSLYYDKESNKVIWSIGRLPVSVDKIEAEFNINITPTENDKDKIMVLLSGTIIQAIDKETKAAINKINKAKTTKLEDDDIAEGDGIVE
ncbi:MAG: hypothetical protein ABIA02_01925 [Candidatus Falkowbacteria bacterium]